MKTYKSSGLRVVQFGRPNRRAWCRVVFGLGTVEVVLLRWHVSLTWWRS